MVLLVQIQQPAMFIIDSMILRQCLQVMNLQTKMPNLRLSTRPMTITIINTKAMFKKEQMKVEIVM